MYDVAIGQDGTIFVASENGLRAYDYLDTTFVRTAYINFNGEARDIAIDSAGTIFVANMWEGLWAFTYNGQSFTNTARISNNGDAHGVTIGPDGTIFLAGLWNGLRAYTYNGSSFTNTAYIHTDGDAHNVAVGTDNTIFVANGWEGLKAYRYTGSSFIYKTHINDGDNNNGEAFHVVVDTAGTIFLANGRDGLRAYNYNGSTFTNAAHISTGGEAMEVGLDSEGTIFLANAWDGLRAFIYEDQSFTLTAHVRDGEDARSLGIKSDGTIFLANRRDGVYTYTYTGYGNIPFFFISPDHSFQNRRFSISVRGINTHFSDGDGTSRVWISKADMNIQASHIQVHSNASMSVDFNIPADLPIGLWDMHIKTSSDSIITRIKAVDIVLEGNYSLLFDGIDDYVVIPPHESLDMANSSLSISVWIKSDNSNDNAKIILEHGSSGESGNYQLMSWNPYHLRFHFENMDEDVNYRANFSDGRWHHVVVVLDTESNKVTLYHNGAMVIQKYVFNEIETSMAPTYIGSKGGNDWFFKGEIDEIRIWKKALTLQEIQANMYRHLSGGEEGLVGYWPLNENSGNKANDLSANSNHGTIYGTAYTEAAAPIGTVMMFCHPNYGYQYHNFFTHIQGANTHFSSGIEKIWLSKEENIINSVNYYSQNNTQIEAKFYIPADSPLGQWSINVETLTDSVLSMPFGIEVLPQPSVTSQDGSTSFWQRSVFAINEETCWSVGNDGSIQKTVDSGNTWETQFSGTENVLYSVYFADEMTGWSVGQYGIILKTTNGGGEWKTLASGTSNNLQSVYFIDSNTGWIVGRSGTIMKTIDGGSTWEAQTSGSSAWLYSVFFINETHGWIVGSNGTIFHTTNGGDIWDEQTSGTTNYLSSIHFIDLNNGWIVGSKGILLRTTDGGKNWHLVNTKTVEWLKSIFFNNDETGWAVGSNGIFIMSEDGGATWSPRKSWTKKTLNSVFFKDDVCGWIVGETGTVLKLMMNNLATSIDKKEVNSILPQHFELYQNYPNPFNPITKINYKIPKSSSVDLSIYNTLGEKIVTLVSGKQAAGYYQIEWNASGFSSGVYFYRLSTEAGNVATRKLVLLK